LGRERGEAHFRDFFNSEPTLIRHRHPIADFFPGAAAAGAYVRRIERAQLFAGTFDHLLSLTLSDFALSGDYSLHLIT
jgi:hypothetical protein